VIIRSRRVVVPDGVKPAAIHIERGRISRIAEHGDVPSGADLYDAGDLVVSPGIVDTHVHVNEPGRTAWEGFDTATRAAAAGGVTTIVDMPLNSVPATTTVDALKAKRASADSRCHVDVAFWGGVVPGNAGELDALVDAGVRGFKCFLAPSGVDEFPCVDEHHLRQALPIIARRGVPLLVHAELPQYFVQAPDPPHQANLPYPTYQPYPPGPTDPPDPTYLPYPTYLPDPTYQPYLPYLSSRPPRAEVEAVRMMIDLSVEFGADVHIVHVACAEAVAEIARAKSRVRITAETCPHYLTFAAEEIPDGATEFKCAPPIREAAHRDALWQGLASGALDLIATDHSPSPPDLKTGRSFEGAWGGIASLELSLPASWTAARTRCESSETAFADLARWLSASPARLAGFASRKGRIAVGCDADVVVWNPAAEKIVDPARLQQRHKLTPYAGRRLHGVVHATFVRGHLVWNGERIAAKPIGQLL
jgi:allantoinase